MKLGYIGLGKMGLGMVKLLLEKGHKVVAFDPNATVLKSAKKAGAVVVGSIEEMATELGKPRLIWIMVPHKFVDGVLKDLTPYLRRGDTVIDGGNSPYSASKKRAKLLAAKGVSYLDVGVSGGPTGARKGACMMVGGKKPVFKKYEKLFRDLTVKKGYAYMGQSGAGHFVKMVHNGIEYGMMQSIAEGFSIMRRTSEFKLDMEKIADIYNRGSVIESRLIEWLGKAYRDLGNDLSGVSGTAAHSGEGKWTTEIAHKLGISDKVIHESLRARIRSKKKPGYQGKVISALRNQFGGHDLKKKKRR